MNISIKKIIKSDHLALVLTIIPIIMLLLAIDARYFGFLGKHFSRSRTSDTSDGILFLKMTIVSILICVPLLLLRIKKINNHFKNGFEVMARIVKISFHKDRGRVKFSYLIENKEYTNTNAIMRNRTTTALKEGIQVSVIVARDNFKKSYLKELFLADSEEDI